jgi:outer membrane PBP1 activator LpoA protein
MKKTLTLIPILAALALAGCSTPNGGITPAQISLATAAAVSGVTIAGQMTPSISNDLNTAAIGLSIMSQGTNITAQQVMDAVSKINDAKARSGVLLGVALWQAFGQQAGADVGSGLAAVSDGIEAGLGNPPIQRTKQVKAWSRPNTRATKWGSK